jgi:hypothetical protein
MGAKTELHLLGCQVFTEDCELVLPLRREAYDIEVYEVDVGKRYFIVCMSGVEKVLVTEKGIITLEEKPRGYMLAYCQHKIDEHLLSK